MLKNIGFVLLGAVLCFVVLKVISGKKSESGETSQAVLELAKTKEASKLIKTPEFVALISTPEFGQLTGTLTSSYITKLTGIL